MPKITTDAPIEQFVYADLEHSSLKKTEVSFWSEDSWADETGEGHSKLSVTYEGNFNWNTGVTRGTITKITYLFTNYNWQYDSVPHETSRTYTLTAGDGVYVSDISLLQKTTLLAEQTLFAGDDDIYGPIVLGFAGNDTFHEYNHSLDGGSGFDTLKFDLIASNVRLDLAVHPTQYKSIERFIGSKYADQMRGDEGNDYFRGDGGNDLLIGRWGNDRLLGDAGNDTLIGGPGRDILSGGAGRDVFVFEKVSESVWRRYDTINDFNRADDLIDLHKIDANSERGGNQEFKFIGNHAFTGHAGELRYFNPTNGSGTHIVADIDGDKVVDFDIFLRYTRHLTADDFDL